MSFRHWTSFLPSSVCDWKSKSVLCLYTGQPGSHGLEETQLPKTPKESYEQEPEKCLGLRCCQRPGSGLCCLRNLARWVLGTSWGTATSGRTAFIWLAWHLGLLCPRALLPYPAPSMMGAHEAAWSTCSITRLAAISGQRGALWAETQMPAHPLGKACMQLL